MILRVAGAGRSVLLFSIAALAILGLATIAAAETVQRSAEPALQGPASSSWTQASEAPGASVLDDPLWLLNNPRPRERSGDEAAALSALSGVGDTAAGGGDGRPLAAQPRYEAPAAAGWRDMIQHWVAPVVLVLGVVVLACIARLGSRRKRRRRRYRMLY